MTATPASNFSFPAAMAPAVIPESTASGSRQQAVLGVRGINFLPVLSADGSAGGAGQNLQAEGLFQETSLEMPFFSDASNPSSEPCFALLLESIAISQASTGELLRPGNSNWETPDVVPKPGSPEPDSVPLAGASATADAGWLALLFANLGAAVPAPPVKTPIQLEPELAPESNNPWRPAAVSADDEGGCAADIPVIESSLPVPLSGTAEVLPDAAWISPAPAPPLAPSLAVGTPPVAAGNIPSRLSLPEPIVRATAPQNQAAGSETIAIGGKPAIELRLHPDNRPGEVAAPSGDASGTVSAEAVITAGGGRDGRVKQTAEPSSGGGRNRDRSPYEGAGAAVEVAGRAENPPGTVPRDPSLISSPPRGRDHSTSEGHGGAANELPGFEASSPAENPVSQQPDPQQRPRLESAAAGPALSFPVAPQGPDSPKATRDSVDRVQALDTVAGMEPVETPTAFRPSQPRHISIDLKDVTGEDVRLTIRDGRSDVEVSVHAGDDAVRDSLRAGLRDLAGNLERAGYRVETPGIEAARGGVLDGGAGFGDGNRGGEDTAGQPPPRHRDPRDPEEPSRSNSGQPDQRNRRNWQQVIEENVWQTP